MIHKTIVETNVTNNSGITVQNNVTAYFSDDYLDYNSRYRLLYALQSINHWYNVQESHL